MVLSGGCPRQGLSRHPPGEEVGLPGSSSLRNRLACPLPPDRDRVMSSNSSTWSRGIGGLFCDGHPAHGTRLSVEGDVGIRSGLPPAAAPDARVSDTARKPWLGENSSRSGPWLPGGSAAGTWYRVIETQGQATPFSIQVSLSEHSRRTRFRGRVRGRGTRREEIPGGGWVAGSRPRARGDLQQDTDRGKRTQGRGAESRPGDPVTSERRDDRENRA